MGFVLDTELRDLLGHDRNISKFNKTEASLFQYSSKQVEKLLQLASRTWKPDSTMMQHYLMEAHIVGGQQRVRQLQAKFWKILALSSSRPKYAIVEHPSCAHVFLLVEIIPGI
jgi:hypothetical protein